MRLSTYAALICCVFLLGCSSDDSNNSALPDTNLPYIGDVYSSIHHFHPTYWKNGAPQVELAFKLDFQIRAGQGDSAVPEIYVRYSDEEFMSELEERVNSFLDDSSHVDLDDEFRWHVLGGSGSVPLNRYYIPEQDEFVTPLVLRYIEDGSDLVPLKNYDLVPLKNYEVHAMDQAGNQVVRYVDFKGFQGEPLEGKTYVYRTGYASPTFEGLSALEAMTVAKNELTFSKDVSTQSFTIEFYHRDRRARNYAVFFYGPEPERSLLGIADYQSPSILSTPLVSGRITRLVIPFSEIDLEDAALEEGVEVEDIEGIHVVLQDTVFEKESPPGEPTSNYYGYSEFVTLPADPVE